MSMADVQHQDRAHRTLQRALASARVPHAYLFAGPEGVGREMMALGLAQLMLCAAPVHRPAWWREPAEPSGSAPGQMEGADACGECQECRLVLAGTHPDLAVIYRQLNRQHPDATIRKQKALFLGVDVIRHFLVDRAGTRPLRGRAKVFVVREAERMNESAQNSLLKTLEEPPKDTILILITTALDRMLPTTRSRCQLVQFRPLPPDFIAQKLAELRPDAAAPERAYVAAHAGGSLGGAARQLDDGLFAIKQAWGTRLAQLAAGGGPAPHTLAKPFLEDGQQLGKAVAARDPDVSDTDATRAGLQSLMSVLGDFCADALRRQSGASLPAINADQPDVVMRLAAWSSETLTRALQTLTAAETSLTRNANMDLTLESLFISLSSHRRLVIPT